MSPWEMEVFIASWEITELSTNANMPEDDFVKGELSILTEGDWIGVRMRMRMRMRISAQEEGRVEPMFPRVC